MFVGGLVSVTFRDKTADEIIGICVKNALAAVEWGENAHVFAGDVEASQKLREKCAANGITIAGYGSYYRCETPSGDASDFMPSLESAAALGAPAIRIWAGTKGSDAADESYTALVAQNAAQAARMAQARGIKVAFEWHRNTLTDTNESAMALLKRAGHENLYCLWQPTPEIPYEQRMEGLKILGDRLCHMHVYSWDDDRKRRPFDAPGFYEKWLAYLAAADKSQDRYALLEFVLGDSEEQLAADAAALKALIRRVS